MILSSEIFNNWQWDQYHIGAVLFLLIIAGAVTYVAIQSYNINKNGKRKKGT